MVKIAVVQMKASTDKERNLTEILRCITRAAKAGAKLVAFPEFMMFYTQSSQTPAQLASQAETLSGKFVGAVRTAARDNSICVVGTLYEKSTKKNRVYDTSFVTDESGKIISKYRKIHLYDALGFKESAKMTPGRKMARPVRTKAGKLGMLICYDLRFPEAARMLASSGSEVIVAPSAWVRGASKEEHWVTINKTRAIENGCYVVAPDQTGNIYCGRSMVVDPYGKVLLDMKKRRGIGYADVSMGEVWRVRAALPLLRGRRTDVYPDLRA